MSGFDRRMWRNAFTSRYQTISLPPEAKEDFATFANDMALLLKWRLTKDLTDWTRAFRGFSDSWGYVTVGPLQQDAPDPVAEEFREWIERMFAGYVMLSPTERQEFLDWLSGGANLPPTGVEFSNSDPTPPHHSPADADRVAIDTTIAS